MPRADRAARGARRRAAADRAGGRAAGGLRGPGRRLDRLRPPRRPARAGASAGAAARARRSSRPPAPRPRSGSRSATTASSPTSYRETLAVANGEYFDAAPVERPGGEQVGYVYGYQGRTSWVLAVVYDGVADGRYELEAVTADGRSAAAAPARDRRRRRQRRRRTPVDYDELAEIRLLDRGGREVADSELRRSRSTRGLGARSTGIG